MIQTLIILAALVFALFWRGAVRTPAVVGNPLDVQSTHILKGICAVIVVMVHFPVAYSNPLQDAAGSFAYVAVTFFFFVSAYGMQYSFFQREDYLKKFWINRLTGLLVPMLLVNVLIYIYAGYSLGAWGSLLLLVELNGYVRVLLEYCLAFYLLRVIARRAGWSQRTFVDIALSILVLGSSLGLYFYQDAAGLANSAWPYERLGLLWGLLAYRYKDRFLRWLDVGNDVKIVVFVIAGIVFGVAYLKFKVVFFMGEYLLKIVLGLVLIVTMFLLSARWRFSNPFGRFLGDISYEVYLSHTVVMWFLAALVPDLSSGAFILLTFVVVIPVSYAVMKLSSCIVSPLKRSLSRFFLRY